MGNLDLKFYWAVFLRRLPYFLVIVAFLTAGAVTVAMILPPVYTSSASMLVEPQQIPGDLAQTTVPVNPYEQAQIIEQRLMTRANLLALAKRIGLYDDIDPPMSANAMVGDISSHIEFIGFVPDATRAPGHPGRHHHRRLLRPRRPATSPTRAPTSWSTSCSRRTSSSAPAGPTTRWSSSRPRSTGSRASSSAQSDKITKFKTENFEALPDSLDERRNQQILEQERLIALQREESDLRNQRATVVWVFERTGALGHRRPAQPRGGAARRAAEPAGAAAHDLRRGEPADPHAGEPARRRCRSSSTTSARPARCPAPTARPAQPTSELDVELAPIDARLKFIAEDEAAIEKTLDDLDKSIQATPANEQMLAGLERELANTQNQYNAAVANAGQAQVGERIEVLSKGERFSLIEQPNLPSKPSSPNRKLIAAAGMLGGIGAGLGLILLMEMLNHSIRRPVRADRPARHRALRHPALHPHPRRGPAQADDRRRGAGADRGGDPGDPLRDPDLLDAARRLLDMRSPRWPRHAAAVVPGAPPAAGAGGSTARPRSREAVPPAP